MYSSKTTVAKPSGMSNPGPTVGKNPFTSTAKTSSAVLPQMANAGPTVGKHPFAGAAKTSMLG